MLSEDSWQMLSQLGHRSKEGEEDSPNILVPTSTFLHDPDNHYGVITHLEPDILEYEVKWALGSITMNKASGGDGIPVKLFQILKDDAVKVLHSISVSGWEKQRNGYRMG